MGCCDNDIPINLSLLTMSDSPINLLSLWLWGGTLLIHLAPYVRPCLLVWKNRERRSKPHSAESDNSTVATGHVVTMIILLLSFHYGTNDQPDVEMFRNNTTLLIGYLILFAASIKLVTTYLTFGWRTLLGGQDVDQSLNSENVSSYRPYYHPYGTSCVFAMLGCSFVRASGAGVLYTLVLAMGYFLAYQIEKDLLRVPKGKSMVPMLAKHFPTTALVVTQINAMIQKYRNTRQLVAKKIVEAAQETQEMGDGNPKLVDGLQKSE